MCEPAVSVTSAYTMSFPQISHLPCGLARPGTPKFLYFRHCCTCAAPNIRLAYNFDDLFDSISVCEYGNHPTTTRLVMSEHELLATLANGSFKRGDVEELSKPDQIYFLAINCWSCGRFNDPGEMQCKGCGMTADRSWTSVWIEAQYWVVVDMEDLMRR